MATAAQNPSVSSRTGRESYPPLSSQRSRTSSVRDSTTSNKAAAASPQLSPNSARRASGSKFLGSRESTLSTEKRTERRTIVTTTGSTTTTKSGQVRTEEL